MFLSAGKISAREEDSCTMNEWTLREAALVCFSKLNSCTHYLLLYVYTSYNIYMLEVH